MNFLFAPDRSNEPFLRHSSHNKYAPCWPETFSFWSITFSPLHLVFGLSFFDLDFSLIKNLCKRWENTLKPKDTHKNDKKESLFSPFTYCKRIQEKLSIVVFFSLFLILLWIVLYVFLFLFLGLTWHGKCCDGPEKTKKKWNASQSITLKHDLHPQFRKPHSQS